MGSLQTTCQGTSEPGAGWFNLFSSRYWKGCLNNDSVIRFAVAEILRLLHTFTYTKCTTLAHKLLLQSPSAIGNHVKAQDLHTYCLHAPCCKTFEAYDALDPNGNITIKWDIISWTADGYVAIVTIFNFQQCRHILTPGCTWDGLGQRRK